jgi:glutamyl-tRNA synthetase
MATPEFIDDIFRSLEWLGIDWDGPPVRQSERGDLYHAAVERLLAEGRAYVDDGAVRFRVPETGSTCWDDVVRGRVTFEHEHVEDFVIRRSDGSPTFFLANAVDDADLGITHVVRGEDLVNVTPKVLLLREALGHEDRPLFAHLPLIVDEQRRKLSKRRHAVAVEDYRDRGYLPEAMANYLALLGWGPPDDVEIRPMGEIVELFELTDINRAPAAFDPRKLEHVNAEYIRGLDPAELLRRAAPFGAPTADPDVLLAAAPLVQPRARTLADVWPSMRFLVGDAVEVDPDAWASTMGTPEAASTLDGALEAYRDCEWSAATLHQVTRELAERRGSKLGKVQAPIRVAVTGRTVGLPLFESLELLGRERTLARLRSARDRQAA